MLRATGGGIWKLWLCSITISRYLCTSGCSIPFVLGVADDALVAAPAAAATAVLVVVVVVVVVLLQLRTRASRR